MRAMSKIDVGSDVEAYCTKCKLVLNHSVVAMQGEKPRRVRCHTCDGEHIYRPEKPASRAASKKAGKTTTKRTTKRTRQSWEEVMREAESKPHKIYSMSCYSIEKRSLFDKIRTVAVRGFNNPLRIESVAKGGLFPVPVELPY